MKKITGTVRDTDGETVIGANIVEKGKPGHGTITDIDGNFTLNVSSNAIISISFIGMETQEISVNNQSTFDVTLHFHSETLDELVVTGYQTISKERATGSFALVSPAALKNKLQPNILSRLEGQVAGLTFNKRGEASIRGTATLLGGSTPLVVVDGMPFEGDIKSINPAIIQNITILKDAAAASIYGAKAANGVLVITTRGGLHDGKTGIAYSGSINITAMPDIQKLNLLNSKELVDLQQHAFKFYTNYKNKRQSMDPVLELLLNHGDKQITDAQLQKGLDLYRGLDNRAQLVDFFLRPAVQHQHNQALSGGNNVNSYVASVNYLGDYGHQKYSQSHQMGFTLQNNMKFFKWLSGNLGIAGTFDTNSRYLGMGSYDTFLRGTPSYFMLYDDNGNPLNIPQEKSDYELNRLRSIGLKDETYSPVTNRTEESLNNRSDYFRMHAGLKFAITTGLNWEIKYQQERAFTKNKSLFGKNSYTVRSMINNAAEYDSDTKKLTLNVPEGGQMKDYKGEMLAYTLRTQLNFNKEIEKHLFTALAGAERRLVRTTGSQAYHFGYDDNSLGFKPVDLNKLEYISGTESLEGTFSFAGSGGAGRNIFLSHNEDRFVSFYGNASYMYNNRYNLTGSIRVDQSNLFGTDPSVQYRPLWSIGGGWFMKQETFMKDINWLDKLNLRLTYGIGGNVPKTVGPYLMVEAAQYNSYLDNFASTILSPPNPRLSWEKTATTNMGVDFSVFGQMFAGSIDFYNKYTTGLLASGEFDSTLGFDQVLYNAGAMSNKGIEITLNGNFAFGNLQWRPSLNYSYNKNVLIDAYGSRNSVWDITGGNAFVKGYPLGSVFGFRYAGLTNEGKPMYYTANGEKKSVINSIPDLVFQGTTTPVYSASFSNTFSYKNIDFSFMFICNGGHVFRAETAPYLSYLSPYNISREILNVWKKPGDELNENTTPGFTGSSVDYTAVYQWPVADKHVRPGAYIKLRDVALSYSFDDRITRLLNIESFSLTLQLQNLWTVWTANKQGIDPEAMATRNHGAGMRILPAPVSWTIGTSINF